MTAPSTPEAQTRSAERHGATVKDGLFFFADTQKPQPLAIKRQLAVKWRGVLLFTTLKKWY